MTNHKRIKNAIHRIHDKVIHWKEISQKNLNINSNVAVAMFVGIIFIKCLTCYLCCRYFCKKRRLRQMERRHSIEHLDELLQSKNDESASNSKSSGLFMDEESTDLSGSYTALLQV